MELLYTIAGRLAKPDDFLHCCFYCGEPATDIEHVFPKSVFKERGYKVWSCRECNLIAGKKVFESIEDKQFFIHEKLQKKYQKLYTFPDWSDEELSEIKGGLRRRVEAAMKAKLWIRRRLQWRFSPQVLMIAKWLQDDLRDEESIYASAEANGVSYRELRSVLCDD